MRPDNLETTDVCLYATNRRPPGRRFHWRNSNGSEAQGMLNRPVVRWWELYDKEERRSFVGCIQTMPILSMYAPYGYLPRLARRATVRNHFAFFLSLARSEGPKTVERARMPAKRRRQRESTTVGGPYMRRSASGLVLALVMTRAVRPLSSFFQVRPW